MRRIVERGVRVLATGLAVLAGQVAMVAFQAQGAFVPLSDADLAKREMLPAAPLVFYAYAFVWLAVMTYMYLLWRRTAKVERELAELSARLKAGTSARGR